jgi:predicted amidohydrolase YtcJ
MLRTTTGLGAAALLAGALIAPVAEPRADLILSGGRVWTAGPTQAWAEAVAISGNRIAYVGDTRGVAHWRGPATRVLALDGRLVLPGFNDSHIHLMSGALSLERVDLIEEATLDAVQARIKTFAAAHPERPWVLGRGWLYGSFPGGLPTREQLDAAVPDRPAYMECYDGHTGWANSRALAQAGITRETKDPENGLIVRDPATGEPTGALEESATALVEEKIPSPDDATRYQLLLQALGQLSAQGLTSVQDAGYSVSELPAVLPLLERAEAEGRLTVRTLAAVRMEPGDVEAPIAEARRLAASHHDGLLRFGTIKGFVDGVIESHTAALLEPYSDDPRFGRGRANWNPEALDAAVVAADAAGLQVYLHAIGDRGVRMALDAHEAALEAHGRRDRRGRIEHIETVDAADIPRFRSLGVIAAMQPLHANPDQNNADVWERNIGPERSARGFAWREIEKAGARLVFGSDWPVVTSDVFRGLYCAVTRKTREGLPPGGWHPELAVSLESALRHYTIDGAYASFEENEKGSLAVGKLADIVVVSPDVFRAPPEALLRTEVLLTIMDGRIVYRASRFPTPDDGSPASGILGSTSGAAPAGPVLESAGRAGGREPGES